MTSRMFSRVSGRRRTTAAALTLAVSACLVATSCSSSQAETTAAPAHPNIVFVLTDDLSMNLVQYMPQVQQLAKDGTSFSNYTVTDSLCCPSRSSIFTGKFPHDTGVFTNGGDDGGFGTFHGRGNENATFGTALQKSGYQTAMMGKYLNGYMAKGTVDGQANYVPPGWNEWAVTDKGYGEYNYDLNHNHQIEHHGSAPTDYLTDVVAGKARDFIGKSASDHNPFFLEVATFAPHSPYTPAPQDKEAFPGLKAPRGPAYDKLPANPPSWLADRKPLTDKEKNKIDTAFRKRAQAVQSVDRMIGSLRDTLTKAGVADNTVVVFSSDNGYHMGEYRLTPGKQTAFDTDVNVPLVAAGPGIKPGQSVPSPVQNIDLAPTFESIGGGTPAPETDGRNLWPLLSSGPTSDWRTASLVEHHGPDTDATDPDKPQKNSGNPTTYEALRTNAYTYVEYASGAAEYYDRTKDPAELNNIAGGLSQARRTELHNALQAMRDCHGQDACWQAGHQAK